MFGGGLTITSTNAAGTTFTVANTATALSIQGGTGTDTIVASGFEFTQAQRDQIFGFTSVEVLQDFYRDIYCTSAEREFSLSHDC